MSLRDFNTPISDDPLALHNEPLGNGSGLESFHTTQPQDIEPNNMPKIVGGVVVALMIGVAGVALYASSGNHPNPVVAADNLPAAPQPAPAPAAMTPNAAMPASTPEPQASPQAAKAAKAATADPNSLRAAEVKTPASGKTASLSRKPGASSESTAPASAADRMAADFSQSTVQPQTQQAVTPEPIAPQPSPSDVATNNTQSGVAVPQGANTAANIPAAPQQPASPDQQQPAQQPGQQGAPQSAGQVTQ